MATKTISIMEDAYNLLAMHKRANESFSDVIRREFGKKGDISKFIGAWKDMPDEEFKAIEDSVRETRENAKARRLNI